MSAFDRNHFTNRAAQIRARCGVDGGLADAERFATWLAHWTVTTVAMPAGPRWRARVQLQIDCDLTDVAGLRHDIIRWTQKECEDEAAERARHWLRDTYEHAFAPEVATTTGSQVFVGPPIPAA